MNRAEFITMMEKDFESIVGINKTKGVEYAGTEDALENFKRHAATLGLTPEQIWAVYASKHWDAVMSFVRTGGVLSEPIEGRIHDVILYSFLLLGLIREKQWTEDDIADVQKKIHENYLVGVKEDLGFVDLATSDPAPLPAPLVTE